MVVEAEIVTNRQSFRQSLFLQAKKKKGEIGVKMREGQTAQNAAKLNSGTQIIATQREGESNKKEADITKPTADLAAKKAEWSKAAQVAESEAKKEVLIREADLQVEVKKNALAMTEKLRAEQLSKATVEHDIKMDVVEAKMKGEIGAKMREGQTSQNAAKLNAETQIIATQREGEAKMEKVKVRSEVRNLTIFENQKEADITKPVAELAAQKAEWSKAALLAEVEAKQAVLIPEAELQFEVKKNALTMTIKLSAEQLIKATVEYDIKFSSYIKGCSQGSSVGDNLNLKEVESGEEGDDDEQEIEQPAGVGGGGQGQGQVGGGQGQGQGQLGGGGLMIPIFLRVEGHEYLHVADAQRQNCLEIGNFDQLGEHIKALVGLAGNANVPEDYQWQLEHFTLDDVFFCYRIPIRYADAITDTDRIVIFAG